jgi:membrane associated rhomboid family serine protease
MVIEEPRPKKRPTVITWIIIAICIIMFIATLGPDGMSINEFSPLAEKLWFVTGDFIHGKNLHTLVTSAFLHGDWIHITSNMYFLWIFGDDAEDVMGRSTFLIFYLFCAVFASVFFALVNVIAYSITLNMSLLTVPAIGASGAIFGVMAAYVLFFPNRLLVVPGYGRVTAKIYIILYAIMETVYVFIGGDNVAHAAHVGGFIAGILFVFVFRKYNRQQYDVLKTGK